MTQKYPGIILLITILVIPLYADNIHGGYGLFYTHSARTLHQGDFDISLHTRYFGKVASFGSKQKAYTLWNVQQIVAFNFGVWENVEVALIPILYQDTNKGGKGFSKQSINVPDDFFLNIKAGSFRGEESPWFFGGLFSMRIPIADQHNIIYEPYSAGKVEIGITGLLSYYSNISFPDESWSAHCNLGYLNHNDVGEELTSDPQDPTAESMSSELIARAGILYPTGGFDFSGEIEARYFMARPPETAYSREYMSYLTVGVYYKPYKYLTFQTGLDLRLISGEDLTVYSTSGQTSLLPPPTSSFPNYPAWRGHMGMKIAILPKSLYQSEDDLLRKQARDRQNLLKKMIEEQKDTEDAEAELSRIRAERKKVEEELERLRKMLEDEKKNNTE